MSTAAATATATAAVQRLDDAALDLVFREARSYPAWTDEPVSDEELRQLYELTRLGPTSMNSNPLRVVFVRGAEAKQRLLPAMFPLNTDKVKSAPVTAVLAYDSAFQEHLPVLFPQKQNARGMVDGLPEPVRHKLAEQSANLQAGYFMLAARSLGLDVGPMGGYDAAKVNESFFPDGRFRTILVVNLGHGDASRLHPRNPRLAFEEACRIE